MTATRIATQIFLVVLASIAALPAVQAHEIACGETLRRTVIPNATDETAFSAAAGEVVSIAVVGSLDGHFFDPRWELYGPTGDLLGGCPRHCEIGPLPMTGRYTISVSRTDGEDGGDYHLSLEAVSATANGQSNGPPAPTCARGADGTRVLVPGVPLAAAIDVPGETDTAVFLAPLDDRVRVTLARDPSFGPGRAKVDVFAPDGSRIENCRESCRTRALVAGAVYTLLIHAGQENATGAYTLLVEPGGSDESVTTTTTSTTTTTTLVPLPPSSWALRHVLRAPERGTPAAFGEALAGGDTRLVVGAPGEATAADGAGAVYVVDLAGGRVSGLAGALHAPTPATDAAFGSAVATVGRGILVGAPGSPGGGAAFLFDSPTDAQPLELGATGAVRLGAAVAATADVVLVGDPGAGRVERFAPDGTRLAPLAPPAGSGLVGFGAALAAAGELVLVGAPGDDATPGGAVLFEASTGALVAVLAPAASTAGDGLGSAVLIDGGVLVVGAPGTGDGAGSVLRFSLDGSPQAPAPCAAGSPGARLGSALAGAPSGILVGAPGVDRLVELDETCEVVRTRAGTPGRLGAAVAFAGGVAVAGAPSADSGGTPGGAVELFGAEGATVVRRHPATSELGAAVDLGAGLALVGAPAERRGVGAAYGFGVGAGTLRTTVDGDDVASGLGASVAVIDASTWAAGAPRAAEGRGSVLVARADGTREQLGRAGLAGDQLGFALVARSGDIVAGAPSAGVLDTGDATVFALDTARPRLTLQKSLPLTGDRFGAALAVEGDAVAVGAPFDDAASANAGAVHLLARADGAQLAVVTSPEPRDGALFGAALALTADALVVGAPGHDAPEAPPGRVYVFDRTTRALRWTLESPSGDPHDGFGAALAATDEAIAVGAPLADEHAPDAGAVFLFAVRDGSLVRRLPNPVPQPFARFGRTLDLTRTDLAVGAPGAARAYLYAAERDPSGAVRALAGAGPVCGDGQLEAGEECDDGNTSGGDDCEADCTRPRCCTATPLATTTCNDRNPCTDDVLDPVRGCSHVPNGLCCEADGECGAKETCRECVGCQLFPWDCCDGGGSSCLVRTPACLGGECLDAVACECSEGITCGGEPAHADVQGLVDEACHQLMTTGRLAFSASPGTRAELRAAVRAARKAVRPARRALRKAKRLTRELARKKEIERVCRDELLERLRTLRRSVPRRRVLRACVAE